MHQSTRAYHTHQMFVQGDFQSVANNV